MSHSQQRVGRRVLTNVFTKADSGMNLRCATSCTRSPHIVISVDVKDSVAMLTSFHSSLKASFVPPHLILQLMHQVRTRHSPSQVNRVSPGILCTECATRRRAPAPSGAVHVQARPLTEDGGARPTCASPHVCFPDAVCRRPSLRTSREWSRSSARCSASPPHTHTFPPYIHDCSVPLPLTARTAVAHHGPATGLGWTAWWRRRTC